MCSMEEYRQFWQAIGEVEKDIKKITKEGLGVFQKHLEWLANVEADNAIYKSSSGLLPSTPGVKRSKRRRVVQSQLRASSSTATSTRSTSTRASRRIQEKSALVAFACDQLDTEDEHRASSGKGSRPSRKPSKMHSQALEQKELMPEVPVEGSDKPSTGPDEPEVKTISSTADTQQTEEKEVEQLFDDETVELPNEKENLQPCRTSTSSAVSKGKSSADTFDPSASDENSDVERPSDVKRGRKCLKKQAPCKKGETTDDECDQVPKRVTRSKMAKATAPQPELGKRISRSTINVGTVFKNATEGLTTQSDSIESLDSEYNNSPSRNCGDLEQQTTVSLMQAAARKSIARAKQIMCSKGSAQVAVPTTVNKAAVSVPTVKPVADSATKVTYSKPGPLSSKRALNVTAANKNVNSDIEKEEDSAFKVPYSKPGPLSSKRVLNIAVTNKHVNSDQEKEEMRHKKQLREQEAARKREEQLRQVAEDTKLKREERVKRVFQLRQEKIRRDKELHERQEREKEERAMRQQKEKEIEIARKNEALAAKSKKMLEKRKQEEEARARQAKAAQKEKTAKVIVDSAIECVPEAEMPAPAVAIQNGPPDYKIEKDISVNVAAEGLLNVTYCKEKETPVSYEITPARKPAPRKSASDYGIDEVKSEDSTDSEQTPKKKIPSWALPQNLDHILQKQSLSVLKNPDMLCDIFPPVVKSADLNAIFGQGAARHKRTSSAVWSTPMGGMKKII